MKPGPRSGMTLVEIMAVVVILGMIAGTLLISFGGSVGRARRELSRSGIGVIAGKLELFRIDRGKWPDNQLGLAALGDGHARPSDSFYLSTSQLVDPWGHPYVLIIPGPIGHPYEVLSYGADGQQGGAVGSDEEDISSINLRSTG